MVKAQLATDRANDSDELRYRKDKTRRQQYSFPFKKVIFREIYRILLMAV